MSEMFTMGFLLIGALFTLLAAVGIVRLPDLFTRMQASTKSATLGVACMMMAALTHFGDLAVGVRALLIITALFLTAPVAAHAIGRAAYLRGVELWEGTIFDELREHREESRGGHETARHDRRRQDYALDEERDDRRRTGDTLVGAKRRRD